MKVTSLSHAFVVAFSTGALVLSGIAWSQRQEAGAVATTPQSAQEMSASFRHVAGKVLPSVVSISTRAKAREMAMEGNPLLDENSPFRQFFGDDPRFRELFREQQRGRRHVPQQRGMGSGFIIDESGVIMTNNHVVRDADEVVVTLHDGRKFTATDIKTDPDTDVAVIRIEGATNLQAARLGDGADVQVGDWVLAVGSPFGYDLTVTAGIISAKGRGIGAVEREDFLQTDAAINPGNSGGPLLNLDGEVIGINTAISSRSGGYDGIGFAIPIQIAGWVSDQLVKSGSVTRGYLGIRNQAIDDDLAKQFDVKAREGVIVRQVVPNSPAEKAGLEPGDVILSMNGKKVSDPRMLQQLVERLEIGKQYPLHVIRGSKPVDLTVTIAELPASVARSGSEEDAPPSEDKDFGDLGLKVDTLTPELAKQFGYGTAKGVVVMDVRQDSAAGIAGVKQGDLIEKVGTTAVATADEFHEAVKQHSLKDGIVLHLRTAEGKRFVVLKQADAE
jgi:serine protease Do